MARMVGPKRPGPAPVGHTSLQELTRLWGIVRTTEEARIAACNGSLVAVRVGGRWYATRENFAAWMRGPKGPPRRKPGPAPLPASAKRSALALVKVTPSERAELEAWAHVTGRPLSALIREAALEAARFPTVSTQAAREAVDTSPRKPAQSRRKR